MTESAAEPTLRLTLKNDSFELERLRTVFDDFADRHRIADRTRFQLQLCLEEMVLNVINYGFDDEDEHDIHIDFEFQADSRIMTVNILDDGRRFDPLTEAAQPDIDARLESRSVGGLGVHLVRTFMDGVSYRYEKRKNRLTLVKNLGQ